MDSIVALDIETTGLDPDKDAIIEIGAVRFNNRRLEGEWSSLINPGAYPHSSLTHWDHRPDGARSAAVASYAVAIQRFRWRFARFRHNIRFDLSFLRRTNITAQRGARYV